LISNFQEAVLYPLQERSLSRKAFVIALALGATTLPIVFAQTGSNLINLGQSIGLTQLGKYGVVYLDKLGEPDASDDAMGRYTSIWVSKKEGGKKDTLLIYSVANNRRNIKPLNGVTILLIRVSSPWYRTSDGLSTGHTLGQILHLFPGAIPIDESQTLYDDAQRGIAFEFPERATANSPCIAIMVHPTANLGDVYLLYDVDLLRRLATTENVNEILRGSGIDP
jgi:hypothetical protein